MDPTALQKAAKIVAIMIDGRQDIADCISQWESAFAIYPKEAPVTDLPEFSFLKGKKDMWGQSYDDPLEIVGLGSTRDNPVTATTEWALILDPNYPRRRYEVAVHEFGHHLMNLCFTDADYRIWEVLRQETIKADLGYGPGLMVNLDEFFAGLTEMYFAIDYYPKWHLETFPPGVLEELEELYGVLTPVETDISGYVRYVTSSGIPLPWTTATEETYRNGTFGFSIDILPGRTQLEERLYTTRMGWNGFSLFIQYQDLSHLAGADDALAKFTETTRNRVKKDHDTWDVFEVKSFQRESANGQDSYWIRYHAHESPDYCAVDLIVRMLIASHNGREYGVFLEGESCAPTISANAQGLEHMLRSFTP